VFVRAVLQNENKNNFIGFEVLTAVVMVFERRKRY
jgi:hypothetical protein